LVAGSAGSTAFAAPAVLMAVVMTVLLKRCAWHPAR
jgi:hypothetical protein